MSLLSALTAEEREAVVSLPFKAAIHIAHAEDEGGEEDDDKELRALERGFSKHLKSPAGIVEEVTAQILKRKSDWHKWTEGSIAIEPACEHAVKILKSHLHDNEVKAYIRYVLDVANYVAQAYGEFGLEPEASMGIAGKIKKFLGGKDDAPQPMNVSAAEDDSLTRIARALKKYA